MASSGRKDRGGRKATQGIVQAAQQESAHPDGEAFFESLFRTMPRASTIWRLSRDEKGVPKDLFVAASNEAFVQLFGAPDPTGRLPLEDRPANDSYAVPQPR